MRYALILFTVAAVAAENKPIKTELGLTSEPTPAAPAEPATARRIVYSPDVIPEIRAATGYNTFIELPKGEEIMDYLIGDRTCELAGPKATNFAWIKPTKQGHTNVHLVTSRGNVYTFSIVSTAPGGVPDQRVIVELPAGSAMYASLERPPLFVPAARLEGTEREMEVLRAETAEAKKAAAEMAETRINEFRASYPASLETGYRYEREKHPFNVKAIWHDDRFTFIDARPVEGFAIYAVADDKLELVNADLLEGGTTYRIPRIVTQGRLTVGDKKMEFYLPGHGK